MFSLRSVAARQGRTPICTQIIKHNTISQTRHLTTLLSKPIPYTTSRPSLRPIAFSKSTPTRRYSAKTSADSLIEDIQEQYGTARDEFEIAVEETEKKTVYAADDRAAAREELDKLRGMYEDALAGPDGEEIKGRIGQRIRELDKAVQAMERSALGD